MVQMEMVDLELAQALYGQGPHKKTAADAKPPKMKKRDYSRGKWLTAESEVERRRAEKERISQEKAEKQRRSEESVLEKERKQALKPHEAEQRKQQR